MKETYGSLPTPDEEPDQNMDSSLPTKHPNTVIDPRKSRFPHCIVWTPIPLLTWLCPLIGHMGIATSNGVIRDFAGPYYVSEDDMAFGEPTKYWQLPLEDVGNGRGRETWDRAVLDASEEYKHHMHNLFCDNCHSHVALALNTMKYKGNTNYNMVKLCFLMPFHSRYVSVFGFLKTWLPFLVILGIIITVVLVTKYQ